MNLLISLRSEALKTKRTASFYLTIIGAAFGPLVSMIDILAFGSIPKDHRSVLFTKIMIEKFELTSYIAFPIFLILLCTLLPQVEYKNNTWKQVFTSPKSKFNLYLAKFLNIQLLVVTF